MGFFAKLFYSRSQQCQDARGGLWNRGVVCKSGMGVSTVGIHKVEEPGLPQILTAIDDFLGDLSNRIATSSEEVSDRLCKRLRRVPQCLENFLEGGKIWGMRFILERLKRFVGDPGDCSKLSLGQAPLVPQILQILHRKYSI